MICYSCKKGITKAYWFGSETMCKDCQTRLRKDTDHGFMIGVTIFLTIAAMAYIFGICYVTM